MQDYDYNTFLFELIGIFPLVLTALELFYCLSTRLNVRLPKKKTNAVFILKNKIEEKLPRVNKTHQNAITCECKKAQRKQTR